MRRRTLCAAGRRARRRSRPQRPARQRTAASPRASRPQPRARRAGQPSTQSQPRFRHRSARNGSPGWGNPAGPSSRCWCATGRERGTGPRRIGPWPSPGRSGFIGSSEPPAVPDPPKRGGRIVPDSPRVRFEPGSRARGPQPSFSPGSFLSGGRQRVGRRPAPGERDGAGPPNRRAVSDSPGDSRNIRRTSRLSFCARGQPAPLANDEGPADDDPLARGIERRLQDDAVGVAARRQVALGNRTSGVQLAFA